MGDNCFKRCSCNQLCKSCRAMGCTPTTLRSRQQKSGSPISPRRRLNWRRAWFQPASSEHCSSSSSRKLSRHRLEIRRQHKTDNLMLRCTRMLLHANGGNHSSLALLLPSISCIACTAESPIFIFSVFCPRTVFPDSIFSTKLVRDRLP